jgi:ribonuclease III
VDGLAGLQERLQHRFRDPRLLARALTHRSFSGDHNERLEFLGDSVLNLAVSSLLHERLGSLQEGELSRVRANLVKEDTLYRLATDLKLGDLLKLGEGAVTSGDRKRPSILADALEALIGAVHLDAGYETAEKVVHHLYRNIEINPGMAQVAKDPKTELQEWLQGRRMKLPAYRIAGTLGSAHKQTFNVECEIAELGIVERGIGATRRGSARPAAPVSRRRRRRRCSR